MSNDTEINTEAAERVYRLTVDLAEVEKNKKDMAAGFSEEIKRIKKEIAAVLKEATEPAAAE